MHGSVQREGEGSKRSPERCISWHMHSAVIAADSNSFVKDGRRISIGDCALFKPPQDTPPFIGLIRQLTRSKDNHNLQLGVNWLYRPAELELGKGTLLESAPNEIFYSFHKDEILAASLLHPCKVAFLPRGVELPSGTSSFVCRRVYDIANKCLWWLTDQDYINERQEEVSQLLHKTRTEMHATLQPGGRSPKQVNGPTSTSQLKSSDNVQNSGTSFPSQVKGKKRERADHSADAVKRERLSRSEDGDSAQYKNGSSLKTEIGRITENGGVVDMEGVQKLVQLMQQDRVEGKMDLSSRSMLASVVAATDKFDCLNRFVQLRGLSVMDEWLQDIHKGKIGDSASSKESDKSVEEFLLLLLRALDKLPVNLQSLQMCNIGRSVNHLRSHKQLEIQRKARSLVETWKKRVEAEMISIEAKSGSIQAVSGWTSKSRLPEASHCGSRTPSGSDVAIKSSVTEHSASKITAKSSHGESNAKSASSSPGIVKQASSPASFKETRMSVGGPPDAPLIREDRSSSSNQSHNHCQSFSGKEEGKSCTAVSGTVSKASSCSSRNRKTSGFPGISVTGAPKETSLSRSSSAPKSGASEKLTSERVLEGPIVEGSSHKLIVKIPNRVLSPAQAVSGISLEDPSIMSSRGSSPAISEKNEEKSDTFRCNGTSDTNGESWQMNDTKVALTGTGEGSGSADRVPDEEISMSIDDSRRSTEEPSVRSTEGLRKDQLKSGKLHDASFSPMNALIESCVKYSEANSSLSLEDDVGMNLLASVAAGEISRSDMVSPDDSTDRSTPAVEEVLNVDDGKSKSYPENDAGGESHSCHDTECDNKKQAIFDGGTGSGEGLDLCVRPSLELSGDMKHVLCETPAVGPTGEDNKDFDSLTKDLGITADAKSDIGERSNGKMDTGSLASPVSTEQMSDGFEDKEVHEEKSPSSNVSADGICERSENNIIVAKETGKPMVEVASPGQPCKGDCKGFVNKELNTGTISQQKVTDGVVKSEFAERADNEKLQQTTSGWKLMSQSIDEVKVGEPDEKDVKSCVSKVERENFTEEVNRNQAVEVHGVVGSFSTANVLKSHHIKVNLENEEISERLSPLEASAAHEVQKNDELVGFKAVSTEPDEAVSASSVAEAAASSARTSILDSKIKFDLNEGFTVDDVKHVEPVDLASPDSAGVRMINAKPFGVNPAPSGHPGLITVAAAAKGPFVPSEELLRSKAELGWKGSAATSAFRPAEPRRVLELPLASTNIACDDASTSKHGRTPLDFDLNVPDERVLEEMASENSGLAIYPTSNFGCNPTTLSNENSGSMPGLASGGLVLDLNRADESNENGLCSASSSKGEGPFAYARPFDDLSAGDVRRDFDLNDGPGIDESSAEQLSINQQVRGSMPSQLPTAGFRMNNPGLGNFASWFPPGNTYSTVPIPSVLSDRGDQNFPVIPPGAPQRTFTPAGITPFTPDVYRGSVLSSSPAVSFPSSHFQFPMFPFGATFPLSSATFPVGAASYADPSTGGTRLFAPSVNSQLLGPVGAIPNQFQRPYMVNLPESSSHGGFESNRKWSRQGLDLNAGPGATEAEARDDLLPLSSSQLSISSAQALADEQARMYSVSGGVLKRKEPEGGWRGM